MSAADEYCVFAYRYRDASNFKANGEVLLVGSYSPATLKVLRQQCDWGNCFIAEQVGIPPLYAELYQFSDGPTSDDVAYHEVDQIRPATPDEVDTLRPWGTFNELVERFRTSKLGIAAYLHMAAEHYRQCLHVMSDAGPHTLRSIDSCR